MSEYIERGVLEAKAVYMHGFGKNKYVPLKAIQQSPAADVVEVNHGTWLGEGDGYADGELVYDVWYCSECNHCIDDGTDDPDLLPNYCPNCGAKMDGE